ncbi:cell death protein 3-like protein, partial [Leptotrombidium deliense]
KNEPEKNMIEKCECRKGLCIFIVNCSYKDGLERLGADEDIRNVETIFTELGYEMVCLKDLSSSELICVLKKHISEATIYDQALFIFVSTHSTAEYISMIDDNLIPYAYIYEAISDSNIPHLREIPKILIIQGCREVEAKIKFQSPLKNYLVAVNREINAEQFECNTKTYISTLCDKIRALGDTELFKILRKVEFMHSKDKRYTFQTDAIGLYKNIYLNNSIRFEYLDDCYNFKCNRKGICIVINSFSFKNRVQIDSSFRDMKYFSDLFNSLGYVVIPKVNLTKNEIFSLFLNVKMRSDLNSYYAIIVMILCSADKNNPNHIFDCNGDTLRIDSIIGNCPRIKKQPTIIFIQTTERGKVQN